MKYDGVVAIIDKLLFLFIFDPDLLEIRDGINISDNICYKDMTENQLMVVSVIFKDGTEEIDNIDLDEFIYGDIYGKYDTFIYIQDLLLYSINDSIVDIIKKGDFSKIVTSIIQEVKNNKDDEKNE